MAVTSSTSNAGYWAVGIVIVLALIFLFAGKAGRYGRGGRDRKRDYDRRRRRRGPRGPPGEDGADGATGPAGPSAPTFSLQCFSVEVPATQIIPALSAGTTIAPWSDSLSTIFYPGTGLNETTGIFTTPATGRWSLKAVLSFVGLGGTGATLQLQVNSVSQIIVPFPSDAGTILSTGEVIISTDVALTAGQVVQLAVMNPTAFAIDIIVSSTWSMQRFQ